MVSERSTAAGSDNHWLHYVEANNNNNDVDVMTRWHNDTICVARYTDMESEDYDFYRGLVFLLENTVDDLGYDLTFSTEVRVAIP